MTKSVNQPKQERSRATHQAILDATMDCLTTYGYAGTSFQRVADMAKLSKGGVHQRFPAKHLLVVEALQNYLDEIRAEAARELPKNVGELSIAERCDFCIQRAWRTIASPRYLALNEVWSASKCDEQLRTALVPIVEKDFTDSEYRSLFPDVEDNEAFKYICDIVIGALEGWAIDGYVIQRLDESASRLEYLSNLMAREISEKCAFSSR